MVSDKTTRVVKEVAEHKKVPTILATLYELLRTEERVSFLEYLTPVEQLRKTIFRAEQRVAYTTRLGFEKYVLKYMRGTTDEELKADLLSKFKDWDMNKDRLPNEQEILDLLRERFPKLEDRTGLFRFMTGRDMQRATLARAGKLCRKHMEATSYAKLVRYANYRAQR